MKTKTMKKALSLFLAVFMIALAMPFTLLTAVAQDAVNNTLSIESVELKGYFKDSKGSRVYLAGHPATASALYELYNGDIACGSSEGDDEVLTFASKSGSNATAYKTSQFVDGVYTCSETEDYDDGYYGVLVIELANVSNVDTFNLWCDSTYAANYPKWISNKSYDIWYSTDGVKYYTTDALKFEDANSEYEAGVYVKQDGTEQGAVVHEVDLGGVAAKYIAVAVNGHATGTTQNEMVFHEVSVEGSTIAVPVSVEGMQPSLIDPDAFRIVGTTTGLNAKEVGFKVDIAHTYEDEIERVETSIKSVDLTLTNGTKNTNVSSFYGSDSSGLGMIDGDRYNTNYGEGSNNDAFPYYWSDYLHNAKRTFYLDDTGAFAKDNTGNAHTYHGYAVFTLDAVSSLDSVTIWLAADGNSSSAAKAWNTPENNWNMCDAYDILYSTDGITWTLDDDKQFEGMCGTGSAVGSGWSTQEELGNITTVTKDGYVRAGHSVPMNGQKALYIAIALKKGSNEAGQNVVIGEVTVEGTIDPEVNKTATFAEGTTTVYTSILADGETYSVDGAFIYALALDGIPSNGVCVIEVTPYFIPKGSDVKVYGETVSFKFVDGVAVQN